MKLISIFTTAFFLLVSCSKSPNGTYLVYKSEKSFGPDKLTESLMHRYASNTYHLSFAEKYVKIIEEENKGVIVLSKRYIMPGQDNYENASIEGADSVSVLVALQINQRDTVLKVSASTASYVSPIGGYEVSVNFYLSKIK